MDSRSQKPASAASVLAFPGARPRSAVNVRAGADQQLLLDTVVNNMSQGVLMFDSDARLVFCNHRYIEMYGLSSEVATPGCALGDLLAHRAAVGSFVGSPEDYIADLLEDIAAGKTSNGILKSADGRVFSIVRNPIAGGGWIATH
jgi:PAS domain-containing protein